jgi:hypothetical protein
MGEDVGLQVFSLGELFAGLTISFGNYASLR